MNDIDLSTMSHEELVALRERVNKAIVDEEAARRKAAVEAVKGVASQMGFSLSDLVDGKAKGPSKASLGSPKYKDPATGETWTGRGRQPEWFKTAMANGLDRKTLEI